MNHYPSVTSLEMPEARCRSGVPPLPACRQRESIYGLIELFIQIVHRLSVRSERRLVKTLLADFQRVHGKTALLFRIAEAALNNPDGLVKEVVYHLHIVEPDRSGKRSSSYLAQLRDVSARGDAVKNGRTLPEQDSGLPALVSDPGLPRMISTVL